GCRFVARGYRSAALAVRLFPRSLIPVIVFLVLHITRGPGYRSHLDCGTHTTCLAPDPDDSMQLSLNHQCRVAEWWRFKERRSALARVFSQNVLSTVNSKKNIAVKATLRHNIKAYPSQFRFPEKARPLAVLCHSESIDLDAREECGYACRQVR